MSANSLSLEDLDRDQLEFRCKQLEIENSCSDWLCGEYQKLLDQVIGGHRIGRAREGREREQIIPSSSRSIPNVPDRRRRQLARRSSSTTSTFSVTPPVPGPLEIVQDRNHENIERFIGIVADLCVDNNPGNRSVVFGRAGLGDYLLAPREATCASQIPEIGWKVFAGLFGGQCYSERPRGRKVPGYRTANFLCLKIVTQPFAPTYIGEPGVVLSIPDAALIGNDFHVFVDRSTGEKRMDLRRLLYCGLYSKAHHRPMSVQIDEWHGLPEECRQTWLDYMKRLKAREVHARCALHKRNRFLSCDPSNSEVRGWIKRCHRGFEEIDRQSIQDAFDSGAEELSFEMISCIGYDTVLAEMLKREAERRKYVP